MNNGPVVLYQDGVAGPNGAYNEGSLGFPTDSWDSTNYWSDIVFTPSTAGAGNTVTVTNPGSQVGATGAAASLQISASDSASGQTLTYSASGLPAGLSINSSTGLISGTPTATGNSSVTVTATDTTGASGSASFLPGASAHAAHGVPVRRPPHRQPQIPCRTNLAHGSTPP